MYFTVIANEGYVLRSIDIWVAFLQSKGLDRELCFEPPRDVKSEVKIWKLKTPLFRQNDASGKFWLKVK